MESNLQNIDKNQHSIETVKLKKNIVHPFSAFFTLVVDLTFFGTDLVTLNLDLPISVILAFTITFIVSFLIQKSQTDDNIVICLLKSFILGILAGIPTPIAGTIAGTVLLSIAGINKIKKK